MGGKKHYTEEFRAEAVRLWHNTGLPFRQVARDLGVPPGTLRTWARASHPVQPVSGAPVPAGALTGDERAELVALRHRVRVLETEREILRKAAAFFAQESERTR